MGHLISPLHQRSGGAGGFALLTDAAPVHNSRPPACVSNPLYALGRLRGCGGGPSQPWRFRHDRSTCAGSRPRSPSMMSPPGADRRHCERRQIWVVFTKQRPVVAYHLTAPPPNDDEDHFGDIPLRRDVGLSPGGISSFELGPSAPGIRRVRGTTMARPARPAVQAADPPMLVRNRSLRLHGERRRIADHAPPAG